MIVPCTGNEGHDNETLLQIGFLDECLTVVLGGSSCAGFSVLGGDPLDPEASPKNPPPDEFSPPPSVPPQSNFVQGVKIPPIAGRPGGEGVDSLKIARKCPHIAK